MALNPHLQNDFATQTYNLIRRFEAMVRRVYNDGVGVPTLGVGTALIIKTGALQNPWQIRQDLDAILQQAGITLTANDKNILERVRNILNGPLSQDEKNQQISQIVPVSQRAVPAPATGPEELLATSQTIINGLPVQNRFSFGTITDDPATGQARQLYNVLMNGLHNDQVNIEGFAEIEGVQSFV